MRKWSIASQVDKVAGRRVAYFGVWPAMRVNSRSGSIGSACCTAEKSGEARLDDFRIDPKYQNNGIGSKLLAEIEKWVVSIGIKHLYGDLSNVDSDHFPMLHHLYTSHGWTWCLFGKGDSRLKPGSPFVGIVEKTFSLEN
jgi:GNAT superfamily N-acetyltransferase